MNGIELIQIKKRKVESKIPIDHMKLYWDIRKNSNSTDDRNRLINIYGVLRKDSTYN